MASQAGGRDVQFMPYSCDDSTKAFVIVFLLNFISVVEQKVPCNVHWYPSENLKPTSLCKGLTSMDL
jgi:hypothetical protein